MTNKKRTIVVKVQGQEKLARVIHVYGDMIHCTIMDAFDAYIHIDTLSNVDRDFVELFRKHQKPARVEKLNKA